jgi:ATP-binding cassette subfamily B protein
MLILDDALSSVDTETERTILDKLKALRQGRTTLIVAHRLSAVQHADEIIVLKDGCIIERGTHASLIKYGGFYATTAHRQELARKLEINTEVA